MKKAPVELSDRPDRAREGRRCGRRQVRALAVLLFKSRSSLGGSESGPRARDEADFARVVPSLDADARAWLMAALRTVHGDHPWLGELAMDVRRATETGLWAPDSRCGVGVAGRPPLRVRRFRSISL